MTKKTRFILITLTLSLYVLWISGGWKIVNGFAGTYPYAESWNIKSDFADVVKIIKQLKQEHPDLIPPGETPETVYEDDWFSVNFFYSDSKEIAHANLSNLGSKLTSIAFTHLSTSEIITKTNNDSLSAKLGLNSGKASDTITEFRTINRDYGYFANKRELRKFEELIVGKIKDKID